MEILFEGWHNESGRQGLRVSEIQWRCRMVNKMLSERGTSQNLNEESLKRRILKT